MKKPDVTLDTVTQCLGVLRSLSGGPTLTSVVRALESGSFSKLIDGSIPNPLMNPESPTLPVDYFAYNLLRKYPFRNGNDRKAVAIAAFLAAEDKCRSTNSTFSTTYRDYPAHHVIMTVREKIRECLGPFSWDSASKHFAFGPGATTRLRNSEGDVYYKFRGKPETTMCNLPLAVAAVGQIPLWYNEIFPLRQEDMFRVVPGSKVTTVPKDAKTDRTIAIEPDMNMYVQKGIAWLLRDRLRRVGVDLDDQTHNQRLARRAYFDGLATVDLSMASDTVSYEVVCTLLPDDWVSALKQCRSPRYVLNNSIGNFEKFSTMGNGYTFELESLIFWAITLVSIEESFVQDRVIGIYGDDIVCPSYTMPWLLRNLTYFGFTPNVDKSFSEGPFYESCGKHYFRGSDITPVFVKDRIDSAERQLWFANSIARWVDRLGDAALGGWDAWVGCFERIPDLYRLPIPDGVGDGGIVPLVRLNKAVPASIKRFYAVACSVIEQPGSTARDYQRGFDFRHHAWVETPLNRDPSDVPYLLRALYRMKDRPTLTFEGLPPVKGGSILVRRRWERKRGWSSSWLALGSTV